MAEFKRDEGIEVKGLPVYEMDLQFDGSNRFWVTYESGEVKVGLLGNDDPLRHYTEEEYSHYEAVDQIELYSKSNTPTVWNFYGDCTILV